MPGKDGEKEAGQPSLQQRKRASEKHAVDAVVRALEADGLKVETVGRPEKPIVGNRTPDASLHIDGELAAIEVVQFRVSQDDVDSAAMASELVAYLNGNVTLATGESGLLHPIVFYEPKALLRTRKKQRLRDIEDIARKMRSALASLQPEGRARVYPTPAWVHSATISLHPSADGGTYAYFDSLGHDIHAVVSAFVQWVIAKKGNQHEGYDRGILAIQQRWLEDPQTLRAAFAGQPAIPWWRVYLVERSGIADLVWTSDKAED